MRGCITKMEYNRKVSTNFRGVREVQITDLNSVKKRFSQCIPYKFQLKRQQFHLIQACPIRMHNFVTVLEQISTISQL